MDEYDLRKTPKQDKHKGKSRCMQYRHKNKHERKRITSTRRFALRRLKSSVVDLDFGFVYQNQADFRCHDGGRRRARCNFGAYLRPQYMPIFAAYVIPRLGFTHFGPSHYDVRSKTHVSIGWVSIKEMHKHIEDGTYLYSDKDNTVLYTELPEGCPEPILRVY